GGRGEGAREARDQCEALVLTEWVHAGRDGVHQAVRQRIADQWIGLSPPATAADLARWGGRSWWLPSLGIGAEEAQLDELRRQEWEAVTRDALDLGLTLDDLRGLHQRVTTRCGPPL